MKVNKPKPEAEEQKNGNGKRDYSTEAIYRALNVALDPDKDKLLSLTEIFTSREAWHYAAELTKADALKQLSLPLGERRSVTDIFLTYLFQLKRSRNARMLMLTMGVAQGQIAEEAVEAEEDKDW